MKHFFKFGKNDDDIQLIDFGVSRDFNYSKELTYCTIQGTPNYFSPEIRKTELTHQYDNEDYQKKMNPFKSDVFSFGKIKINSKINE